MSEDASAGTLHVDVVADVSGLRRDLQEKLKTELAKVRGSVQAQAAFNNTQVRKALNDSLKAAGPASNAAKASVSFNPVQVRKALNDALRQAAIGSTGIRATVNVDVDDRAARTKLAALGKNVKVKVDVDADTKGASEDIDGMRKRQSRNPINVPVNVDRSALSAVGSALSALSSAPAIASGVLTLVGAVGNLAGGLFAVASSASQAVGVLAVLPNLAGLAAQAAGTLVLGFSGIGEAVKAMGKAQTSAGQAATSSAATQAAAAERIRSAQENVARAQEAAAERVQAARENLARSQESAAERSAAAEQRLADVQVQAGRQIQEAQRKVADAHAGTVRALEDLSAATADAIQHQKDLALELSGGALDEESAKLAIERAKARLDAINGPGSTGTALDKKEADLAYRESLQRLKEVQNRNEQLTKEKEQLDKTGIAGSAGVVAAQRRVTEAVQEEQQAREDLRTTAADAAKDIAQAQADVTKAQRDGAREVASAQRDLAKAQRDAGRQVADAQRALRQAMAQAATDTGKTTGAVNALNAALANLGPAGQKFARFISDDLKPRFDKLRQAVQEALLPHIQKAIQLGLPLLGTLKKGLVDSAGRIGGLAEKLGTLFGSKTFNKDVSSIMASNNRALSDFGEAGLDVIKILVRVAKAAGPILLEPFARWVKTMADAAEKSKALSTSRITDFLTRAAKTAKTLYGFLSNIAIAIYNVARAARPTGDTMLQDLATWAKQLREATEKPENIKRIQDFFAGTLPIMRQVGSILERIGQLFGRFSEITGGDSLNGLFWILNRILDVLEGISNLPGGGTILTALLTLSGAGLGLGIFAKGLGSIVSNVKTLSKFTGVTKLLSALGQTKAVSALGSALAAVPGKAGSAVKKGAQAAAGGVKKGVSAAGSAVARGATSVGSSIAGSAVGQAGAAALARAGEAAKTAAAKVSGFVVQMAKAGGTAILSGIRNAASAIGSVAAAAGRGVLALASLALEYGKAGLAAAISAGKQLLVAAAQKVIKAATLAWTGVQWALNAALDANPIGIIVLAIAALVAGVIWAYNNVKWFRDGVDTAFKWIGQAATWLWQTILKPFFDAIGFGAKWLWENGLKPFFAAFTDFLLNTVGPKVLWFHNNIVKPTFNLIAAAAKWLWENGLKPAFEALNFIITKVIGPTISWLYNNIVKPVFSLVVGAVKTAIGILTGNFDILKSGLQTMGNAWKSIWNAIVSLLSAVWNNGIKPLLTGLINFVTKTVPGAFKTAVDNIKLFWDKLQAIAKNPVAFIVNTIYNRGIRVLWNWISEKVGGNLGQLPEIKGFAGGGILPGTSSYRQGDDQLVAMRRGEGVYVSEAMRDPYERARLFAVNKAAMAGRSLAAFRDGGLAQGGIVGVPGFSIGGIIGDFIAKGRKFFADGLKSALNGVMNPIINLTDNTIGKAGGFGQLIAQIPRRARDNLIDFIMRFAGVLEGGDGKGVVAAARKYLGVGDDRGMDNNNIFTRMWGWPAGTPWCALFASTAIKDAHAGKAYKGYPTAAVWAYATHMKQVGLGEGRAGDLATYGSSYDHVNIITGPRSGGLYPTIGGNQGPVVNAYSRGAQRYILRPEFAAARGGIVPGMLSRVFGERNADRADRKNPIIKLMNSLSPDVAARVGTALSQVPSLVRDSGGPLYPGQNFVTNSTGGLEWVLTPQAVAMLGGPRAVQSINDTARLHSAGQASTAVPRVAGKAPATGVTQNIYPQRGQSEQEIAMIAARKLGTLLRR